MPRAAVISLSGRLVVALLLVAALAISTLSVEKAGPEIVILLDDSRSMDHRIGVGDWAQIERWLENTAAGGRVSLIRFAGEVRAAVPPKQVSKVALEDLRAAFLATSPATLDRDDTDIGRALGEALRRLDGARDVAVLLVTDGHDQAGMMDGSIQRAAAAGVRVLWLPTESPPPPLRIVAAHAPPKARIGQSVPLTVTTTGIVPAHAILTIRLGDDVVAQEEIAVGPDLATRTLLHVAPETAGPQRLELTLAPIAAADEVADRWSAVLHVLGRAPVLIVSRASATTPLAQSLRAGGWATSQLRPSQFPVEIADLRRFALIILDDLAIHDMPEPAWRRLSATVRRGDAGLVVLGGPNSFAAGSYYRSELEKLLPVTAETRDPDSAAAVMFLVDKSGSMGREERGATRFAYARRAVLETAKSLEDGDRVGLAWFDALPAEGVAFAAGRRHGDALDLAWSAAPGGGTVLAPALGAAIDALSTAPEKRRLLVLVTDGFLLGEGDGRDLVDRAAANGVDVIAMLIGGDDRTGLLRRLTEAGDGILLRVDDVVELPRLMRPGFEQWRRPSRTGPVMPLVAERLPFLAGVNNWPVLSGYAATSQKDNAQVYLRSETGEPLLAGRDVGAARVVALPGGLGEWAEDWLRWPHWGDFVGGLVEWAQRRDAGADLWIETADRGRARHITIEAVGEDGEWLVDVAARLETVTEDGGVAEVPLAQTAPGRFDGDVTGENRDVRSMTVTVGGRSVSWLAPSQIEHERRYADPVKAKLREFERKGLVGIWLPDQRQFPVASIGHENAPGIILVISLGLFMCLMIIEINLVK